MARANTIIEFKASQPFIDACVVYYGDRFEDCLKQARSISPNLELSKITMDDPLPTTLIGDDIVNEETDDSIQSEQDPKDDGVVLAQPVVEWPIALLAPSVDDPPLTPGTVPLKMPKTLLLNTMKTLLLKTPKTF